MRTKTNQTNPFLRPALITALGFILAGPVVAQTFSTLHNFTTTAQLGGPGFPYVNNDGAIPQAGLILAGNTLYGTATYGGTGGGGTVFAVKTNGSGFTNLYSFTATYGTVVPPYPYTNSDGTRPYGGVVLLGNTLYGTASEGGSAGEGTVFAVKTNGSGFTNLHNFPIALAPNFNNSDGWRPFAGLVLSGNTLFGTAAFGGVWGQPSSYLPGVGGGTVFAVNTTGTGFTNLHSFTRASFTNSDGCRSVAGLVLSGNTLYGTAQYGGSSGGGVVFAINTDGTSFTNLHDFTGSLNDASSPQAGLILSGNTLYGTAMVGGSSGNGVVFAINTDGTGFTNLHSFAGPANSGFGITNTDGVNPQAGLVLSGNTLYGTTSTGGSSGNGTVFAVNTSGEGFTVLHHFTTTFYSGWPNYSYTNTDGSTPKAGLVLSGNTLYGTASAGGSSGNGTVFRIVLPLPAQPQITLQPQSQTVSCGSNANFTMTATGGAPLAYQWRKNNSPIPGATTNSYSVTPLACQVPDNYSVVVTNSAGAVTSSIVTLTVVDTNPPTLVCPAAIVTNTSAGQCSAVVTYSVTATDDCAGVSLTVSPPSGSVFLKGTNVVNCLAVDCGGNSNTCSFTVTVLDPEPPTLTCPSNQSVLCLTASGTRVFFSPTAGDNCGGAVPVVCSPPSGSYFRPGETTVNCVATDASGNTNSCSFTITGTLTNTSLFPPDAAAYGRTYSDWSAAWWAWNFSLPATAHPLLDTADVSAGQSGPVWFLGGRFGASGTNVRSATIPEGTALFFPIVNAWADNSNCPVYDHFTEAELRGFAQSIQDQANGMTCIIDGVAVAGLENPTNTPYRVRSPVFDYLLPAAHSLHYDVLGATCFTNDTGTPIPVTGAVADGVFVMLPPLSVGTHTIHLMGAVGDPASFTEDVTYNLTVVSDLGNAAVYPPGASFAGKSYGEWSAAWWQWCFSLPAGGHPLFDTADGSAGQSGPVWFLGGTFGGPGTRTRTLSVPDGKCLFFPIINNWADNTDCPVQDSFTEAQLRAIAGGNQDQATNLSCTIDGLPVTGLADPIHTPYRVTSPVFTYTIPGSDNLLAYLGLACFTNAAGTPILVNADAVADGVFLLLPPLPPGPHTIHFYGAIGDPPSFYEDITYNLTVTAPKLTFALQGGFAMLSWPQTATTYQLEQSDTLAPANWSLATAAVSVSAGNCQVKIPATEGRKFFRLKTAGASVFGRSLAEWQEVYWRWAYGQPQPVPTTDTHGNATLGNVVLMAMPNAAGDGTPASTNLTLNASEAFVLPLWNLLGNSYTAASGFPPDDLIALQVFETLDLTLKLDGVTIMDSGNLMQNFSQFSFVPPLAFNSPPASAFIWLQGIGVVHGPLSSGSHTLTLDAKNTDSADLFGLVFEYHNTWNLTVQP